MIFFPDGPRLEKSPLLANGYNHPPTHLNHMQFMQLGQHPHTAILNPGLGHPGLGRPDGSIIKSQPLPAMDAIARYEGADSFRSINWIANIVSQFSYLWLRFNGFNLILSERRFKFTLVTHWSADEIGCGFDIMSYRVFHNWGGGGVCVQIWDAVYFYISFFPLLFRINTNRKKNYLKI